MKPPKFWKAGRRSRVRAATPELALVPKEQSEQPEVVIRANSVVFGSSCRRVRVVCFSSHAQDDVTTR